MLHSAPSPPPSVEEDYCLSILQLKDSFRVAAIQPGPPLVITLWLSVAVSLPACLLAYLSVLVASCRLKCVREQLSLLCIRGIVAAYRMCQSLFSSRFPDCFALFLLSYV